MIGGSAGNIKITGESTGAVKALDGVEKKSKEVGTATNSMASTITSAITKWGGLALAIGAASAAYKVLKASHDQWWEAQKQSADLFSQFGDLGFGGAQMASAIQDSADGMIKIQTAARSMNILVRSEIGATVAEVQSLAKASVDIARKVGGDADQIMQEITLAITTGRLRGLKQYGILINESTVEIDAHIQALEKFGQSANTHDIALFKSRNILKEIHGTYQDTIISVNDINEIENKYQNERQRNMALSAKYTEESAKKIQALKHSWQDVKDSVTGYFNTIETSTSKVQQMISGGAQRQINSFRSEFFWALEDAFGKAAEALPFEQQMEVFTRQAITTADELGARIEYQIKTQKGLSQDELQRLDQEVFKNTKVNEVLKEKARLNLQFQRDQYGVMSEQADQAAAVLDSLEKRGKKLEEINKTVADQRVFRLAEDGLKRVDAVIRSTNEYLLSNTKQLAEYQGMSRDQIAKAATESERAALEVKRQLDYYDSVKKLGRELTVEQRAHLGVLEQQSKEIKSQQGLMQQVLELMFGGKAQKAQKTTGKTATPGWLQEFQRLTEVLKKGDPEMIAHIEEKYGTADFGALRDVLRTRNSEIYKMEQTLNTEIDAKAKERGEAQLLQMEAQAESERNAAEALMKTYLDTEEQSLNVFRSITQDRTLSTQEREQAVNDIIKTEARIRAEIEKNEGWLGEEFLRTQNDRLLQIEKDRETARTALLQEEFDKRKKVMDEEAKKIKDLTQQTTRDITNMADQALRGTMNSMYDAMNMSNAALKEANMSRGEVLARALKETAESIKKEAMIRSGLEVAYGLANLAMGNPKAKMHFAAALAFAGVAGVAAATAAGISAPSDAEVRRRKEGRETLANSRAGAGVTAEGGGKVINIYWPEGMFLGDRDTLVRTIHAMEDDAERRGRQ